MSFQDEQKILVVSLAAYERPPAASRCLLESCRRYGFELTRIGHREPYPNNWSKPRIVADYLRDHPEYKYVLQVDFRDVIFCATLREIYHKYRSIGRQIVISAEAICWPMPSHAAHFPNRGTRNRYVNSGAIFATSEAWQAAWTRMRGKQWQTRGRSPERGYGGRHIFDSDQAAWSDLYIHKEADIAIDTRCQIFQTLRHLDHEVGTANRDLAFEGTRIVNRESGDRPCLVHCNSSVPMEPWARYILEPPVAWTGPLIDRIRRASPAALLDPAQLEPLLLFLGLHEPIDDDVPVDLLPYSGKGLAIRRRPTEFAPFLAWLACRPPIGSYVEIGVGDGGSFITTIEYLRRFHTIRLAIGVGPGAPAVLLDYIARTENVHHHRGIRALDGLGAIAQHGGHVDLVVIDADRSHGDVQDDWEHARSCSRYVAIHGIAVEGSPASSLWEHVRTTHRRTREFIDPRLPIESRAGLGVVDLAYGDA